jgi:hypothetical protein
MRWTMVFLVVLLAGSAAVGLAQKGEKEIADESRTIQGILVDMKCYPVNMEANVGDDHQTPKGKMPACATTCAKMGLPVGLLVGGEVGGELVVLITISTALGDYMTKEARVTGVSILEGKGIIPDKIEVKKGDEWKEVKVATMM